MHDLKLTVSDVNHIYNELSSVSEFDFNDYAFSFKKSIILKYMSLNNIPVADDFIFKLNNSASFVSEFIKTIFVPQTEMFRDPELWNYMQEKTFPKLLLKKEVNIHIPVCITGEEINSLMFFLGLYKSTHVTITVSYPLKEHEEQIKNRIFTQKDIKACEKNIELLKNILNPEDVFSGHSNQMKINHFYRGQMRFEQCDIRNQQNISEFDLILFRNRLIYYNEYLQDEILKKIIGSLKKGGLLILGERETLGQFSGKFKKINSNLSIYKKRII